MMFDMTGVTRQYVDMEMDYDGVEYTGPDTLLEYTVSEEKQYSKKNSVSIFQFSIIQFSKVGDMMLKNMGNATDSNYAGMKVLWCLIVIVIVIASSPFNDNSDHQVSLLLTRRWFYHAVSVFLQSVLLLVVAYTTFYYRVDNFQVCSL